MYVIAPAGNLERFYSAIKAGADEIYMGIKGFGARRNAENFTISQYKEAIDYAHERGVRVFLTLNTLMMDNEIEALYHNIRVLYEHGLDAIIVQDLGLFKFIRENFPEIEIHGSTQMTVANHVEANYLKSIGFSRVVLPRELSFEEIKSIREKTDIELEIFVSGALCISYSGNCYMSSFIGGRSGNRGMCAQPCRKFYKSENGEEGYLLSPKDQLLGFEEIKKLKDIGIDSIKLEGRMKDPNYVFETVSYYKNLVAGSDREEKTSSIFNRGYGKGYFYGATSEIINKKYPASLGKEIGIFSGKEVRLKEKIVLGDGVTFLSKDFEKLGGSYINKIEIKGKKESSREGHPGEIAIFNQIPKGTKYLYRSYAKEINDLAEMEMKKQDKKLSVEIEFLGEIGKQAKLVIKGMDGNGKEIEVQVISEEDIAVAQKRATSKEEIKEKLLEMGDTTFTCKKIEVVADENIFIPVSKLKSLRRAATEKFKEKLLESYRRQGMEMEIKVEREEIVTKTPIFSAIVSNEEQREAVKKQGIQKIYNKGYDVVKEGNLDKIDLRNRLASNLYQALENKNSNITLNWNLNIGNRYSLKEIEKLKNVDTVILSPEISYKRIEEIGETTIKKAILGYSRPKGMYVEIPLLKNGRETIVNEQGDKFTLIQNELGNTEIYLENPLNILKDEEFLGKIGISEIVLEFTVETAEEIEEIFNRVLDYRAYNYERGVF